MKIAQTGGGGDFYESFSDLIFGTLIIFLVVVLALIIQVHDTVERMDRQIGGVVSPNRFTGSTGLPAFTFILLPGDTVGESADTAVVLFLPVELGAKVKLTPEPYTTDVFLDLTELYRKDDLLWMTVDEFVGMAGGLTPETTLPNYATCPALGLNDPGFFIYAFYQLEKLDPARMKDINIGMMRDLMWGTDWYSQNLSAKDQRDREWLAGMNFRQTYDYYMQWLGGFGADGRTEREMIDPFNQASLGMINRPTGVRLTVLEGQGKKLKVGRTRFEPDALRLLLEALTPGRDFVVECVDEDGEPIAPPPWVEQELLFPAGYDARVLKDPGLE